MCKIYQFYYLSNINILIKSVNEEYKQRSQWHPCCLNIQRGHVHLDAHPLLSQIMTGDISIHSGNKTKIPESFLTLLLSFLSNRSITESCQYYLPNSSRVSHLFSSPITNYQRARVTPQLLLRAVVLQGNSTSQGTLGKEWRRFWWSNLGRGSGNV